MQRFGIYVNDSLKSADLKKDLKKKELMLLLWRSFLQAFQRNQPPMENVSFRSVPEVMGGIGYCANMCMGGSGGVCVCVCVCVGLEEGGGHG